MASPICKHDKSARRPFSGMRVTSVAPDEVRFCCDDCGRSITVARCAALTQAGIRCKHPAGTLATLCRLHAGKAKR